MKTVIRCILVLTCLAICILSSPIKKCQCLTTNRTVTTSLIADVKVYEPRPYCKKKEVIAKLKDGNFQCLDPTAAFIQAVLRTINRQKARQAQKMNSTVLPTTTAPAEMTT